MPTKHLERMILSGKRLEVFPLKMGNKTKMPLSMLLFHILLEAPASTIGLQEKKKKERKKRNTGRKEKKHTAYTENKEIKLPFVSE